MGGGDGGEHRGGAIAQGTDCRTVPDWSSRRLPAFLRSASEFARLEAAACAHRDTHHSGDRRALAYFSQHSQSAGLGFHYEERTRALSRLLLVLLLQRACIPILEHASPSRLPSAPPLALLALP